MEFESGIPEDLRESARELDGAFSLW